MYNDLGRPAAMIWRRDAHSHITPSSNGLGLDISRLSTLVLEKTEIMRETLSSVLRNLGVVNVRAAGSVDYALELHMDQPADIVFTDWAPGLNGIGFLKALRNDPVSPNPFVPVIMVTANTEPRHVYFARDNGMTEYLAKPYTAKTVYKHICSIAANRRPFVKLSNFFGPDRRRRISAFMGTDRRAAA